MSDIRHRGQVDYSIRSCIDAKSNSKAGAEALCFFTVINPVPACLYPTPLELRQTKEVRPVVCCFENVFAQSIGNIEVHGSLGSSAFSPGEVISLKLGINNTTDQDGVVKIKLRRTKCLGGGLYDKRSHLFTSIEFLKTWSFPVGQGRCVIDSTVDQKYLMRVPPLPPSYHGYDANFFKLHQDAKDNHVLNWNGRRVRKEDLDTVLWSYDLHVSVYLPGACVPAGTTKMLFPIVVAAIPQDIYIQPNFSIPAPSDPSEGQGGLNKYSIWKLQDLQPVIPRHLASYQSVYHQVPSEVLETIGDQLMFVPNDIPRSVLNIYNWHSLLAYKPEYTPQYIYYNPRALNQESAAPGAPRQPLY